MENPDGAAPGPTDPDQRAAEGYDEEGYLNFHIGDANNPACYYLIVKE